jgi:tRNA-dihydrouridine synthase
VKNFWKNLPKPIYVLAPMADVTDAAFRQIINTYGKPDVFWTEFVAADGLAHPKAREKLMIDLKYSEEEHPIVAQIFGGKPENIKAAAALCQELGFDGVDINMGCPDRAIERQCAGSAMIKNPELAKAVIRAAKEGAPNIPISVKTRIGYNKNEIETWIKEILSEDIAALTVHLRTRKEMSDVPAHWDLMKRIVEIRNEMAKDTLIIGNGDATDLEDAKKNLLVVPQSIYLRASNRVIPWQTIQRHVQCSVGSLMCAWRTESWSSKSWQSLYNFIYKKCYHTNQGPDKKSKLQFFLAANL